MWSDMKNDASRGIVVGYAIERVDTAVTTTMAGSWGCKDRESASVADGNLAGYNVVRLRVCSMVVRSKSYPCCC